MQEAWVWFLVKELKSHRLQGQKKILNKTNKKKVYNLKSFEQIKKEEETETISLVLRAKV